MKQDRITFIDNAKTLATFLVIYCHLCSVWSNERLYVHAFHMPFFFFISGLLFEKKRERKENLVKIVKGVIIPLFLYSIIGFIFNIAIGNDVIYVLKSSVIGLINGSGFKINEVCWFLIALVWCKLIANEIINNPLKGIVLWVICCGAFMKNTLFIAQGCMAVPFFMFGYYAKNKIIEISKQSFLKYMWIFLFAISALITHFNGRVSMYAHSFGNLGLLSIVLFYLNGIIGSFGLISISLISKTNHTFLTEYNKSMISAVGLQSIFITMFKNRFGLDNDIIVNFITTIGIMLGCYLLHLIIIKPITKFINSKLKIQRLIINESPLITCQLDYSYTGYSTPHFLGFEYNIKSLTVENNSIVVQGSVKECYEIEWYDWSEQTFKEEDCKKIADAFRDIADGLLSHADEIDAANFE